VKGRNSSKISIDVISAAGDTQNFEAWAHVARVMRNNKILCIYRPCDTGGFVRGLNETYHRSRDLIALFTGSNHCAFELTPRTSIHNLPINPGGWVKEGQIHVQIGN